ncbi:response regulator transcription factor [Azonexus sp.]|uniref:response regulator transcription factor n=1 Tax=Azonexus sp. TaxID=1872668 RepID=UPI0039E525D6
MFQICIVDRHATPEQPLAQQMTAAGYGVACFAEIKALYGHLLQAPCDVVLLDVTQLAAEDITVIPTLRRSVRPVGVIALVAAGDYAQRLQSYSLGSDVCLEKPASAHEIMAILPNLIERLYGAVALAAKAQAAGPLDGPAAPAESAWVLRNDAWSLVSPEGKAFQLGAKERLFMQQVMRTPDEIVSREAIVEILAADAAEWDPQSMDTMLSRLRRKIDNAGLTLPLRTVRGQGYMFLSHSQRHLER